MHMATKVSWNVLDYAAKDVLSDLMDRFDTSYREMEDMLQGSVTYSRIRDIRLGRRAPVRLSEFIEISSLCHCPPEQALQMVFDKARELSETGYEQEAHDVAEDMRQRLDAIIAGESEPTAVDLDRALHVSDLGLAAKHGDADSEQDEYEAEP